MKSASRWNLQVGNSNIFKWVKRTRQKEVGENEKFETGSGCKWKIHSKHIHPPSTKMKQIHSQIHNFDKFTHLFRFHPPQRVFLMLDQNRHSIEGLTLGIANRVKHSTRCSRVVSHKRGRNTSLPSDLVGFFDRSLFVYLCLFRIDGNFKFSCKVLTSRKSQKKLLLWFIHIAIGVSYLLRLLLELNFCLLLFARI